MSAPQPKKRFGLLLPFLLPTVGAFLGAFLAGELVLSAPDKAHHPLFKSAGGKSDQSKAAEAVQGRVEAPGVWGRMSRRGVSLEPPRNLLYPELCDPNPPNFDLSPHSQSELYQRWKALKLRNSTVEKLVAATKCEEHGCRLLPSLELLRSLNREERRAFYGFIATLTEADEHAPFRRSNTDSLRWKPRPGVGPKVASMIKELEYQDGELTHFSDLSLLCDAAQGNDEKVEVVATLARMSSLMVQLHVDEGEDVAKLARYWGRGWRSKNVRPLLESLARAPGGGSLDVVHLLPPFARQLLYSYPASETPTYNCFWTAMNFFADEPDEGFIDEDYTASVLLRSYEGVEMDNLEFGDVIAFLDAEGSLIHAVTHIAGDVVFTKNGLNVWRPWVLMSLNDVLHIYPGTTPAAFRNKRYL